MTGNLSQNSGFFKNIADFFNGKTIELHHACVVLSGKELGKGDVANSSKKKISLIDGKHTLRKNLCMIWRQSGV